MKTQKTPLVSTAQPCLCPGMTRERKSALKSYLKARLKCLSKLVSKNRKIPHDVTTTNSRGSHWPPKTSSNWTRTYLWCSQSEPTQLRCWSHLLSGHAQAHLKVTLPVRRVTMTHTIITSILIPAARGGNTGQQIQNNTRLVPGQVGWDRPHRPGQIWPRKQITIYLKERTLMRHRKTTFWYSYEKERKVKWCCKRKAATNL